MTLGTAKERIGALRPRLGVDFLEWLASSGVPGQPVWRPGTGRTVGRPGTRRRGGESRRTTHLSGRKTAAQLDAVARLGIHEAVDLDYWGFR